MSILSIVTDKLGPDVAKYLANKHRGGSHGAKGADYESHFATVKFAERARDLLEKSIDCKFISQHFCFVDDFVIINNDTDVQYFQLKNSSAIKWDTGKHPLYLDFEFQRELSTCTGIRKVSCQLVISDLNSARYLWYSMPESIAEYSSVYHFPHAANMRELRLQVPEFNYAIRKLCAFPEEDDKLDAVAIILQSVWLDASPSNHTPAEVSALLRKAKRTQPSYIRGVIDPIPLNDKVKEILGKIPDFSYSTSNGFFSWNWHDGLESGTLAYDCSDPRFKKFQEILMDSSPSCFSELEGLLL